MADTQAVFGQVKVPLSQGIRLVGGLRYSWDFKSYFRTIRQTVPAAAKFHHFDWKAGVEFDAGENSHFYATAASGYRPGGISPALPNLGFSNEELTSFEIGSKNDLFDRKVRLNLSAYLYDYKGFQFSNLTFPGGIPTLSIVNLPKVRNYGAEMELVVHPVPADTIAVSAAYLHSRIDSAFVLSPQNVQLQGAALPNSPKFTANATWSHNFKLGGVLVTPSASVRYSDSYYVLLPLSAQSLQDAWTEFDASLTIAPEGSGLSLTGFIRNAGNRVVKSNFIGNRLSLQSPRTFGVTASAKF